MYGKYGLDLKFLSRGLILLEDASHTNDMNNSVGTSTSLRRQLQPIPLFESCLIDIEKRLEQVHTYILSHYIRSLALTHTYTHADVKIHTPSLYRWYQSTSHFETLRPS